MDLNAPLGKERPPTRRRPFGLIAAVTIVTAALVGLGVFLLNADPHGGEPYVVAAIPPAAPKAKPASLSPIAPIDALPTGSIRTSDTSSLGTGRVENGVEVFRAAQPPSSQPSEGGPLVIDVTKALDDSHRLPGANPIDTKTSGGPPPPRIAIFVSGMGLSDAATRAAIKKMPPAVSLAFVPYGASVAASVAAAKAAGHEVLLQVPMQSGEGPSPGPHALRADESSGAATQDLAWLMGRFDGYDGVANLLGAPVTGDAKAMNAILKAVASRGMFYLDDGTSRRSLGPSLAAGLGVPALVCDVILDATADPAVVRGNLDTLASIARGKGSAIGMASGLPDHLAAIARFAAGLGAQGITLVPVSALVAHDATRTVNR